MKNPLSEMIKSDTVPDEPYKGMTFDRRGLRWVITRLVAENDTHVAVEATLDDLADPDGEQEIPGSPLHCWKVPKALINP